MYVPFFSFSQPARNIAPARITVATMGRILVFAIVIFYLSDRLLTFFRLSARMRFRLLPPALLMPPPRVALLFKQGQPYPTGGSALLAKCARPLNSSVFLYLNINISSIYKTIFSPQISQKNLKKCKRIFHIFIIYWDTNGCKNVKIPFFFRHVAEFRIRILITFAFGTGRTAVRPDINL